MRFYWEKVEAAGNFANKIWNASRFVCMNMPEKEVVMDLNRLDVADKWILSRLNTVIKDVTDNMEKYELGLAAQKVYDFIWSEFCDWYIEMAKPRLYGDDALVKENVCAVLKHVLIDALKLLHPFMPFITEEIYTEFLDAGESIMISEYPKYNCAYEFLDDENDMNEGMEIIKGVRNIRSQMNVPPSKKAKVLIKTDKPEKTNNIRAYIEKLASASEVRILTDGENPPEGAASCVFAAGEVFLPLGELIDIEKELARLFKEKDNLNNEIARASSKLSNEKFIAKAPEKVVAEEKEKLAKYTVMLEKLEERIVSLKKL